MKPHPRIRKTIKWGGAAVTVLLVVVWVGSGWCDCTIARSDDVYVSVSHGRLEVQYWRWFDRMMASDEVVFGEPPRRFRQEPFGMRWWFSWQNQLPQYCYLQLPLWFPAAVAAGGCAASWRLDALARRRAKGGLNLCPKCGYDRTGLVSKDAKCPECGAAP